MCHRSDFAHLMPDEELVGWVGDTPPEYLEAAAEIVGHLDEEDIDGAVQVFRAYAPEERRYVASVLRALIRESEEAPPADEWPMQGEGWISRHVRGQAMVEFALILPLLLLVTIGAIWFSLFLLQHSRLDHLAREAATAGAMDGSNACSTAQEAVERLTTAPGPSFACSVADDVVTVTLSDHLPVPPPLDAIASGDLEAVESAIIREASGTPAPSPSPEEPAP